MELPIRIWRGEGRRSADAAIGHRSSSTTRKGCEDVGHDEDGFVVGRQMRRSECVLPTVGYVSTVFVRWTELGSAKCLSGANGELQRKIGRCLLACTPVGQGCAPFLQTSSGHYPDSQVCGP